MVCASEETVWLRLALASPMSTAWVLDLFNEPVAEELVDVNDDSFTQASYFHELSICCGFGFP